MFHWHQYICFSEDILDFADTQRKPIGSVSSNCGGQSFSSSSSFSQDLHSNYDDEQGDELHTQVDLENSFEDLEQFLTQLDWAAPHGTSDDTGSELELSSDQGQDEGNIQELEMRAVREHLTAVVKDIHIAIGEHSD